MIRRSLLLFLIIAGCGSPATTPVPVSPAADDWSDWYQCVRSEATTTVVIRLTIPGLFDQRKFEIPIRRDRIERPVPTTNGFYNRPGGGHGMIGPMVICADGSNAKGGFGYVGSIGLAADQAENSPILNLRVNFTWTTAEQVHGHLDQTVPVAIGKPADLPLRGGGRLVAEWVDPATARSNGGTAQATTREIQPAIDAPYIIKRVEVFMISIVGLDQTNVETNKPVRVSAKDGCISVPRLTARIRVEGMTEAEAENAIIKAYRDAGFARVQISIENRVGRPKNVGAGQ